MSQFIYTMKGLGKIYPPDQKVFEDIWLSFIYGAKIGIIGGNGAGKSSRPGPAPRSRHRYHV